MPARPLQSPAARATQLVLWVAVIGLSLAMGEVSFGAGGYTYSLPMTAKNPSGLSIKIDGRGIDANGYRPILFEVSPKGGKPLTADRQIRVTLDLHRYGSQTSAKVSRVIELPEGSTSVRQTLLVPQAGSWSTISLETHEGGELQKDLSQQYLRWPNVNGWSWTEARPALLFVDSHVALRGDRDAAVSDLQKNAIDPAPMYELPDVRPLLSLFPDITTPSGVPGSAAAAASRASFGVRISDTTLLGLISARSRTDMLRPDELPSRWIELSQYDVAVISLADLDKMAEANSSQLAALRDWLSTGPMLLVYGVGENFARLAELERLLSLPPILVTENSHPQWRGWTPADKRRNTAQLSASIGDVDETEAVPIPGSPGDFTAKPAETAPATDESPGINATQDPWAVGAPPFVLRDAMTGSVVAIAADQPFPGTQKDWIWVFNSVNENHWKWFRRNGCSLQRTNDDYWKLLIPGVGEAPVISFLLLVSLFAVVIGPVNFLLLGRVRRLYLLLITVPVGAALVTVSLFVFALLSDGLGTRLRIRSYADLDQPTGRAAVWSRQSYYAAMAPSQGLVFPEDTTAFPIAYQPGSASNDRATLLHWDGAQQFRRGYLSSRAAAQFTVCRATTTSARLLIREGAAGKPPQVENRLGAPMRHLLVRDSHGDYFTATSLPDGVTRELTQTDVAAAQQAMQRLNDEVLPIEPRGYDPNFHNDNLFSLLGIRRTRFPTSDSSAGDPLMAKGLLETNLDAALRPSIRPLDPGTYLAIVETSPLVVTGLPRGSEEASFHVIRGKY